MQPERAGDAEDWDNSVLVQHGAFRGVGRVTLRCANLNDSAGVAPPQTIPQDMSKKRHTKEARIRAIRKHESGRSQSEICRQLNTTAPPRYHMEKPDTEIALGGILRPQVLRELLPAVLARPTRMEPPASKSLENITSGLANR